MKVKICGITNIEDSLLCSELGADAIGFIFYRNSKRYVSVEKTFKICRQLPPFLSKVGVFVNESADKINRITNLLNLDYVQFHGDESAEFCDKINSKIIKAFRINDDFDFRVVENYKNHNILLDTYSSIDYGGTGQSFDWNLIPEELKGKIILSGGISSENITKVYNNIKPSAVDLSSSVEFSPGKKDGYKLKEFFNKLNRVRYNASSIKS